jgi:hypothetical protein
MNSQTEYFRNRLLQHDASIKEIEAKSVIVNITGKKRNYEEAFEYVNDYEIVQESEFFVTNKIVNKGNNWIDAYLENLIKK